MDTHLTKQETEFFENLKNPIWRLNNLYYIQNKNGKRVLFKTNWAQKYIVDNLWFFSIILKARQLGVTTFFCLLYLDQVLFNSNKTAGIIAHTDKDTKAIFEKIKFAWNNLLPELQDALGPTNTDSAGEMSFPNGSKIFVSRSVRGGTLNFLHISEFGKVCAQYPAKAKEIVTGSINAVEKGNFVTIESTAEGRSGYFFDFCQEAQQAMRDKRHLTPLDFKFFFFPWWQEPTYTVESNFVITKEYQDYFDSLEKVHGVPTLTEGQKRWYIVKKKKNGEDMKREYPSTADEAFATSIEGAYFHTQMQKVYDEQRIRAVPYDSRFPVDTWWDLGMNDLNIILFTQAIGNEIRFIDEYYNSGEGLSHYVNILREKDYVYGTHTFPHDVEVRNLDSEGKSRRETLIDLGVRNIRTIERTKDVNDDIEGVRKLFSRFYFNEEKTEKLIDSLNNYKKAWDDKRGEFKNYPLHDKHSHFADCLRLLVKGWKWHEAAIHNKGGDATITNFF